VFWLLPAYAASTFVADEPGLAELATVAWAQAVACTGREAQAYPTVVVDVGRVTGGFAGKASTVGEGWRVTAAADGEVARETAVSGLYSVQQSSQLVAS
jgi:hypothetical protein